MKKKYVLTGMHCSHCVRAVEELLKNTNGIRESTVGIGSVEIATDESWNGEDQLIKAL